MVAAARDVRDRLEELGLVAFCKTTGGKGLHVVTRSVPRRGPGLADRQGLRQDGERMAAEAPDLYVANMAKNRRQGRIFLDYLRNDRLSTAVAPLSPRAREGATVSFPLNWISGPRGSRPAPLYDPHRARPARQDHRLGRLRGGRAPAGNGDQAPRLRSEDEPNPNKAVQLGLKTRRSGSARVRYGETRMKKLLTTAMALSIAASGGAAFAQPHGDHHRDKAEREVRTRHPQGGTQVRPRGSQGPQALPCGRLSPPAGLCVPRHPAARPVPAGRLPGRALPDRRLPLLRPAPPPRGYYYTRVDNDVLLTAAATGLIASVIVDLFQ